MLGMRIGKHDAPLQERRGAGHILELRIARAVNHHIARSAADVQAVQVDGPAGLSEREHRVLDVVARSEKSRLPGRERDEHDRPVGRRTHAAKRLGEHQEAGHSGCIVDRAVQHRPARIAAQAVPVGAVDHVLVLALPAEQETDEVGGVETAHGILDVRIERQAHGYGFERRTAGGGGECGIVESGLREQSPPGRARHPAIHAESLCSGAASSSRAPLNVFATAAHS